MRVALMVIALLGCFGAGWATGGDVDYDRDVAACVAHGHEWGAISDLTTPRKGDMIETCFVRPID